MPKLFTIQEVADAIGGKLVGKGDVQVSRVVHPSDIREETDLALAVDDKLLPLLQNTKVRAAVLNAQAEVWPGLAVAIMVDRPRLAMAKLTKLFDEPVSLPLGVHPTATLEEGVRLGQSVTIGAGAYVGRGAVIGDGSVLYPQTYVGDEAVLGREALLYPGVRIGARVIIGDRFIAHFNASIGADGFSFVTPQLGSVEYAKQSGSAAVVSSNYELIRIASLGTVLIDDDVEVGASTSIDRGTIAATRIGRGTKIDNQVQIGHNVVIGENCLICGRVGIAGSAVIGDRVVLGGATGIADHVKVGDDAIAMALSGIAGNVASKTIIGGIPAVPRDRMMENILNIGRIKQLVNKVNSLIERVDQLDKGRNQ